MKILCLDFDGVIHSYTHGWMGVDIIPDPPVPGAIAFLREAVKHFDVQIFSSRSREDAGRRAMRDWLIRAIVAEEPTDGLVGIIRTDDLPWWAAIKFPTQKPAAFVSLDDRCITFTGEWPSMDTLAAFKPWNK